MISSSASVPLVHAFVSQGINIGAGMVLLLVGPVTSLGTILVLFDDISTKKGVKKEQGNCRSSVLLVAGGANQGYNL